jgi:hypothetical protein
VIGAVASLNPVRIINSVTDGAALVTQVVVQTTIGVPQKLAATAADTTRSTSFARPIPSIAESILNGRRLIANALSPARAVAAQAPVAAAKVATSKVKSTVKTVHKAAAGAKSSK